MARSRQLLLLALLLGTVSGAPAAYAQQAKQTKQGKQGWVLCNGSSYIQQAAIARPQGGKQIVEGWIRLRPGECRQAVPAPLAKGSYLLFAQSSTSHRGGRQTWTGDRQLCVDVRPNFSFENPKSCSSMGLEQRLARMVTINARENWTTWLMEAEVNSLAAARAAGVSRLLEDAGYESRRADGTVRRRSASEMLNRFLTDARLPAKASHAQVVDALEVSAAKRRQEAGLKVCNRAKSKAWTAVAQRKSDGWETRGWWQLAPGGCAKLVNDTLFQPVYYVHAVLESPTGDRQVAAANAPFCVGRARFAIVGQEDCGKRYYETAMFFPISPQGKPGLNLDLPESSFGPPPARRAISRAAAMAAVAAAQQAPQMGPASPLPAPATANAAPSTSAPEWSVPRSAGTTGPAPAQPAPTKPVVPTKPVQ